MLDVPGEGQRDEGWDEGMKVFTISIFVTCESQFEAVTHSPSPPLAPQTESLEQATRI